MSIRAGDGWELVQRAPCHCVLRRRLPQGGEIDRPTADSDHGRNGRLFDPFGHRWASAAAGQHQEQSIADRRQATSVGHVVGSHGRRRTPHRWHDRLPGHSGQGLGLPNGPVPAPGGAVSMATNSSLPPPPDTPRATTRPTPGAYNLYSRTSGSKVMVSLVSNMSA